MPIRLTRAAALAALTCGITACLPTHQAARVEPRFRVDVGAMFIADQPRNEVVQGHDWLVTLSPAYGFGHRFEIGVPLGFYGEDGFEDGSFGPTILPYAKLALLPSDSKNHLSVSAQAVAIFPANVSVQFGRDLGKWEPQIGVSYIVTTGPAGDDPIVTRYQQLNQTLRTASFAAAWNSPRRPTLEVGVLRNSYDRCSEYSNCPPNNGPVRVVLHDLFVGFRAAVVK